MKYAPYSYSKMSLHGQCNRKFKYKYIDKIKVPFVYNEALLKGGAIHSILEEFPEKSTHKLAEKYQHIADKFLQTDLAKEIFSNNSIREMSFGLTEKLEPCGYSDNNAIYRGFIDYIYTQDDMLHVVDWKTGKAKEEKWQDYTQLMTYAIYFFQRYEKLQTIKIRYVYVEHNLENPIILERKYLQNYINELMTNINNAEHDELFVKNKTKLCEWCDFEEYCDSDL